MGLIASFEEEGIRVIVLSDHGVSEVSDAISINRFLREKGLITVRNEGRFEMLDTGLCQAFAVTDHQIAHVYLNDPGLRWKVWHLLETLDGVGYLLDEPEKLQHHLHHPRAGDIVAVAKEDRWFTPEFGDAPSKDPLPGISRPRERKPWSSQTRGSYGAPPESSLDHPLFITQTDVLMDNPIEATDVASLILQHLKVSGLTSCI
jgi:predicted AlkP superfamily pyrophosphatase or phosphodiesterase